MLESAGKKGNQMVNKSYQSSEIGGGEDTHTGDPEYAKDFNSAYAKVSHTHELICAVGRKDLPRTRKHSSRILGRDLPTRT